MNLTTIIKTSAAVMALNLSGFAFAGGEGWISDFAAAKKEAADSKKDLLIDFTGSDWCGWCIKLNKEVFSHEPFKVGVKDKFVLVELDYPRDKSKLTEETIKQNEELGKKYEIAGYPTILLCDASGKPYAATGYQEGGPEKYVTHLDELIGKKAKRDEALASAAKSEGVPKAKALVAALKDMELTDGMVANFYGDVVEQIKASDPKDETGFMKEAVLKEKIAGIKKDLGTALQKKDFEGAIAVLDKALKDGDLPKDDVQQIMMTRGMLLGELKKYDEGIKALDEAKAFNPESPYAGNMDAAKKRLLEAKEKAASGT